MDVRRETSKNPHESHSFTVVRIAMILGCRGSVAEGFSGSLGVLFKGMELRTLEVLGSEG